MEKETQKFGSIEITERFDDMFISVNGEESDIINLSPSVALLLLDDEPDTPEARNEIIEMFWYDDIMPLLSEAKIDDVNDFHEYFMHRSNFAIKVNMA